MCGTMPKPPYRGDQTSRPLGGLGTLDMCSEIVCNFETNYNTKTFLNNYYCQICMLDTFDIKF